MRHLTSHLILACLVKFNLVFKCRYVKKDFAELSFILFIRLFKAELLGHCINPVPEGIYKIGIRIGALP